MWGKLLHHRRLLWTEPSSRKCRERKVGGRRSESALTRRRKVARHLRRRGTAHGVRFERQLRRQRGGNGRRRASGGQLECLASDAHGLAPAHAEREPVQLVILQLQLLGGEDAKRLRRAGMSSYRALTNASSASWRRLNDTKPQFRLRARSSSVNGHMILMLLTVPYRPNSSRRSCSAKEKGWCQLIFADIIVLLGCLWFWETSWTSICSWWPGRPRGRTPTRHILPPRKALLVWS